MRVRRVALQIWALFTLAWLAGVGVIGGSGFLEVRLADAVRLEQHAKDLRAAGIDPASIDWTAPAQINGYVVPPVKLQSAAFWAVEAPRYAALGASAPLGSLLLIEALASLMGALRGAPRQRKLKALVFADHAGSVLPCNTAPAYAPAFAKSRATHRRLR